MHTWHRGCRAHWEQHSSRQQQPTVPAAPCRRFLQRMSGLSHTRAIDVSLQQLLPQPQQTIQLPPLVEQHPAQQLSPHQQRWRSDRKQQRQEQRRQRLWCDDRSSFVQHSTTPLVAGSAAGALQGLQDSEPYIPADTAAGRDRQLTSHIKKRSHWTQLQLIWLDNSTNFSPIHLTATMTKLARLVEMQGVAAADRPELFKFSSAIMSSLRLLIDALDARGAAQCLWAYAKLQSLSPHHSRSGDTAADALMTVLLQQHMQQLQPQELSQVAWATAVLQPAGLRTPAGFWCSFQDRLLLLLPDAAPSEVACFAWAPAKVHAPPRPAVIAAVMQHATDRMCDYRARELLQLLLAAAAWQHAPPAAWKEGCMQRLEQLVPDMPAQDISHTLLSLAKLQVQPSGALLSALLRRLQLQLPAASREVLVTVPYALAKLQLNPGSGWWAGFLPYTTVAMQSFNPAGLSVLAWSLARLGMHPGQPWIYELLQHSGYKLGGFAAQELSMLVWALGKWQAVPSASWQERFERVSADRCEDFTAAELGAVFAGVAGMGAGHLATMEAGTGTASWQIQQGQQQQQQLLLSPAWSAKLLAAAQCGLSGAPADCLAGIFTGLAKLGVRPSLAWLQGFEAAAADAMSQASIGNVAAILWGYAALEVRPSWSLGRLLNNRLCELLSGNRINSRSSARRPSSAAAEAGETQGAAAAAENCNQSASNLPTAAAAAEADQPSPAVAAQLLWSLAKLPYHGNPPWLDDLLQGVLPRVAAARCNSKTLVMLLWGVARLGHKPGNPLWLDAWWNAYLTVSFSGGKSAGIGSIRKSPRLQGVSDAAEVANSAATACTVQQYHHQDTTVVQCVSAGSQMAADTSLSLLTAVLWSFNRLQLTPSSETWLGVVLQTSEPLLPAVSGQALSGLLRQLVRLKVWPGEVWLAAAADGLLQKWQQQCSKRDVLLQALGCMYKLGYVPPVHQAAQLKAAVVARK